MWEIIAAQAALGTMTGWQQARAAAEMQRQQNEIAKKEADDEARRRLVDYFSAQNNLTEQQRQTNQAMSEQMANVAQDYARKTSTLSVATGESNIGGNLSTRLNQAMRSKEVKELGTLEANRRNAVRSIQNEKIKAFDNAAPPTVHYYDPADPTLWNHVTGTLGAGGKFI